nr:hypothetical protein [Oscillospiraceae bacterium]
MDLEQEIASIIAFAQRIAGDISYYYWNLPEDFHSPALFFPQPEITTGGETFRTYASEYAWYIKVFAKTTEQAHSIALSILTALKRAKNYVPLINEDGELTKEKLRLKDPSLKGLDMGIEQVVIEWKSRRPYDLPTPPKMQHFKIFYEHKDEKEVKK